MPYSSQEVKIFPDYTYNPLLSLGQLADAGYTFQGDHKQMMLTHSNHKNLCAARCPSSGMYLMSLIKPHSAPPPLTVPSMPTLQACSTRFNKVTNYLVNNVFAMATKPDLTMYYHCAAFSPVPTTFISVAPPTSSPLMWLSGLIQRYICQLDVNGRFTSYLNHLAPLCAALRRSRVSQFHQGVVGGVPKPSYLLLS